MCCYKMPQHANTQLAKKTIRRINKNLFREYKIETIGVSIHYAELLPEIANSSIIFSIFLTKKTFPND
jgi:hypothetical protein